MNRKRLAAALLRILIAFAIASPVTPQDENQPYFSLSSNQTFGAGSKPFVQVSAYGISQVGIRVYRIHDPVQFVRQLEDAHQFGESYGQRGKKPGLLARLRQWKKSLRRDIRYDLRHQFTESPRAHLFPNSSEKTNEKSNRKVEYYADTPVLNAQQLVLSFVQTVSSTGRWDSEKVDIPVKQTGLYLVEAVNGKLRAYTILNVSNLVLVTKTARDRILFYVTNRTTGEPVPNAAVTVIEKRNATGTTLHTGADGTADYAIQGTPANDLRSVAGNQGEVAFDDIGNWNFQRGARNLTGLVYTDRPVYRPGDTMHFRGILRYAQTVGYTVPQHETFSVQVTDKDGKTIYQKQLSTSAQGVIHDELALAKDAGLGNYSIEVRTGESTAVGNFEVQEYKKPEYEVHVTPEAGRVLQGESTKVTIDSKYYFGEPVTGAKVKYAIYKSRYWFPLWRDADDEQNASADQPDDYGYNTQTNEGEGTLDADGRFSFDLPTDVEDKKQDTLYRIEAGVTDKAGREISGSGWVVATYGTFVLNVQPDRWFYQPKQNATFTVQARDYDRKPIAGTRVHVELRRYNWYDRSAGPVLGSSDVTTGADGDGNVTLRVPDEGGDYRLVASAPSGDRTVETDQYVWVSGWSSLYGDADPSQTIQVVADKKTYKPGDTAQIMIATGQDNTPVLVTVEGRDIRSHSMLRSKGGTAVFNYKVTKDDEPGFFVSVQFVRGGVMYQKEKRIKVPPDDHKLTIKLATDKPQYQPGGQATYNIEVTNCDGKPAAQTDLSLGVVDEAIYAIVPDRTPDPVETFYGQTGNYVSTSNSLTYYFSGEAGTRRMQLAAVPAPRKLAQLKPEQLVQPKIRKYFPDTTFWAADITTDTNGHAQAKFDFPDSLTTWRATARGASIDDRYGAATLKTIVRKNLMIRLAVPRFFVQGDEVVISAIVHNYLQTGKQAKVNVKLEGLDLVSGAPSQDVPVPVRGEAKVDWRVKAQLARKAKITAAALTNEESDALELELPINPPGVLLREPHSGSIADAGKQNLTIAYPATAVTGSRAISIKLAPSVAGSIFSALEYLTAFPYGCVEQTMSSFLPDVIVTKAMRELKLKQPLDQDLLARKTQAGLERLYGFHHQDGGWGWWTSDDSHPFMTAYVVDGLSEARSAGVDVDADAIDKGDTWIEDYFARNNNIAPDLHAYMAYALAVSGRPDKTALEQLYAHRSDLSSYGLAILGLAFEVVHDKRASGMAADLVKNVEQDEREARWPASRDEMLDFSADITPETTAYATKLISHEQPNNALLPKAALWLVDHRNEGFWWSSTKQTAMVIYGLIDYVKATKELNPNLHATVLVNGQPAGTAQFGEDSLASTTAISLDESKLRPDTNQIEIETTGSGRLYYSISGDYYSNEAKAQNKGAVSLNILRDYYKLTPQKSGTEIVYDLQPLNGPVAQGDVLAVRLTVTGSDWRYLLVEDPIPAGTEFAKDDKLYHLSQKPSWWEYYFTERENHDNRIAIFDSWFYREQRQYFYVLKVVNPGLFHINPARVQPMYQPEYQATTGAVTLEVK